MWALRSCPKTKGVNFSFLYARTPLSIEISVVIVILGALAPEDSRRREMLVRNRGRQSSQRCDQRGSYRAAGPLTPKCRTP